MAETYAYRVRDRGGSLVTGELVADSQDLALAKLREMGGIPIEIKPKRRGLRREIQLRPGRVKLKKMAVFSRQFATMINSGLPLLRALSILQEQSEDRVLQRVLSEMRADVEKGTSLSVAMSKHPRTFSRLYVAMCRSGEASGNLDEVLLRLADNLEKEVSLRHKVKSALTYPTVVLGLVLIILAVMLVFVVPTFEDLYAELGGTLPFPTRLLLAISAGVRHYFLFVLGGIALIVFLFYRWIQTEGGRNAIDRFKLKAPVFGPLFHKTALSRFARTFAVLSSSGVPLLQALDIVAETVNNKVVAKAVLDVKSSVKEGETIAKPLARHAVFPPMVVQMLSVGEETGALDTMLEKVAAFYDEEVSATVESLTSLIEPILIALIGLTVGAVVVALYLPMFRIFELIR